MRSMDFTLHKQAWLAGKSHRRLLAGTVICFGDFPAMFDDDGKLDRKTIIGSTDVQTVISKIQDIIR